MVCGMVCGVSGMYSLEFLKPPANREGHLPASIAAGWRWRNTNDKNEIEMDHMRPLSPKC